MSKDIDKWSFWYWFWKHLVNFSFKNYYSRVVSRNAKSIPHRWPVIIVMNHQNALMDALAILTTNKYQPVFLARSDVFKGKTVIAILTFLKILPIYRIRDGAAQLKKNEEIFEKTLRVLKNKENPLGLMPEGNHGGKRRLRPLMKGVFRIAFQAQEDYGNAPGVKILPVGLDYEHYQKYGKSLFVNYGEPIEVAEYYDQYTANPVQAINDFRAYLAQKMKEVMIHIESKKYYDLYQNLRMVYNPIMRHHLGFQGNSLPEKFDADKKMIEILNNNQDKLEAPNQDMNFYQKNLQKMKLRDWLFRKEKYPMGNLLLDYLFLMVGFPFYVLGLINNYLPFKIPQFATKKIKDKQFHSSFKYVIGMVLFAVYYLLFMIAALVFLRPFWLSLLYITLMYPSGKFAFFYYKKIKKTGGKRRYNNLRRKKDNGFLELKKIRTQIIQAMDEIVTSELKKKGANQSLNPGPCSVKAS